MSITNSDLFLNQIEVHDWNFEKIAQDFDIFQIELDKHTDRNILNVKDSSFHVLATVYYHGQQCFILTHKHQTDELALQYVLNKETEGKEGHCIVREVKLRSLARKSDNMRKLFGYRNRALLQLLINSTLNSIFEDEEYNNITGRCYYWNPEWNEDAKKLELVDLTIERDMVLYPSVRTFTQAKDEDIRNKVRIVLDKKSNTIRRALRSDKESDIYYKQGVSGTHASRGFDGTSLEEWEKSRMSCVARFFQRIQSELAKYVSINLTKVKAERITLDKLPVTDSAMLQILRNSGINFIDRVVLSPKEQSSQDAKIGKLVRWIEESRKAYLKELKSYCRENGINFSTYKRGTQYLNIELVRTEKFYGINKDLNDAYKQNDDIVSQHATVPVNYKNKDGEVLKPFKDKLKTILKELAIKADVRERKISLIEWGRFGLDKPVSFYMAFPCKKTEEDKKKGKRPVLFKGMTVAPDGAFTLEQFMVEDINHPYTEDPAKSIIIKSFFRTNFGIEYFDRNTELLMFEDINERYVIRRTNIRAISNIQAMEKSFMDEKEDCLLDTDIILNAIEALQYDMNPSNVEVYYSILNATVGKEEILKSELLPCLRMKSKRLCRKAKEAIENATGVVIRVGRTANNAEEKLGTSSYRHIHIWPTEEYDNNGDDSNDAPSKIYCYTVGSVEAPNQSIPTAPIVRQIIRCNKTEPDKEFVLKMIGMLQVGFVKNNNYTVLPFTAKYLRES